MPTPTLLGNHSQFASSRQAIFNPRELFGANEQGLWLDPSDMTATKAAWRRNLLTYSEQFDNAAWTKQTTTTVNANVTTAPDGTLTADRIIDNSSGGTSDNYCRFSLTLPSAGTYTFSIYAKAGQLTWCSITQLLFDSGTLSTFFDLQNGVIGATNQNSGTITSVGNGWYRITGRITTTSDLTGAIGVYLADGNGDLVTDNDGTSSIFLWGAQLELGSTPTDYQKITDFSTEFKAAFPTHTLYQDSNGVTPCTDSGQPVGLILDQSRGGLGALGSELVPDPTLTSTTGWVLDASWTASGGNLVADNSAQAAQTFASSPEILTQGKQYLVVIEITAITGAGGIRLDCRPTAGGTGATNHATITTTGTHRVIVNNTGANTRLALRLASNTQVTTATVASISVREVPGNHAYQTTSASRPTLARIPSSGRRNLLTRTEEFDNAAWVKTTSSISANATTSPDGTTTADKLIEDSNNAAHYATLTTSFVGGTYTFSCYAKAAERSWFLMEVQTAGVYAYFNLGNGTVGTTAGSPTTSITPVGNGWYRCSISASFTSITLARVYVASADNAGIYLGNGTSGIFIWGAQLETGSSATNYQKVVATTDVTESGVGDLWHLVFDGSDDSLVTNSVDFATWTQETRRNLLVDTESFGTSNWTKVASTITEGIEAISGVTALAARLTEDNTSAAHAINQTWVSSASTQYTFSCYMKAGTRSFGLLSFPSTPFGGTTRAWFDLANGTLGTQNNCVATITSVGNGWYRCSILATSTAGGSGTPTIQVASANGTSVYLGDGTSSILIGPAQIESGSLTTYQRVGTDEMTVIAGHRRLSDSAAAVLCELSADVNTAANNGFAILQPAAASSSCEFLLRGDVGYSQARYSDSSAPVTSVMSYSMDKSLSSAETFSWRKNGLELTFTQVSNANNTDNFGNKPLFIGRRNQASLPYNGHIYQLIIRGKTTPTGKLLEAEKFVSKKTGVNL